MSMLGLDKDKALLGLGALASGLATLALVKSKKNAPAGSRRRDAPIRSVCGALDPSARPQKKYLVQVLVTKQGL